MALKFQPYDWKEYLFDPNKTDIEQIRYDYTTEGQAKLRNLHQSMLEIHCWALTLDHKNVWVRIRGFPSSCYLKLPKEANGFPVIWNEAKAASVFKTLQIKMADYAPYAFRLVHKNELYYITSEDNNTVPMLELFFRNSLHVRKINRAVTYGLWCENIHSFSGKKTSVQTEALETDVDDIRKFMSAKDLTYCQFISIAEPDKWVVPSANKVSPTIDHELIVNWEDLQPIPLAISNDWITHPKIFTFDLECNSEQIKGFPDRFRTEDVVTMISICVQRFKLRETRKRYCLVLGEVNEEVCLEILRRTSPNLSGREVKFIGVKDEIQLFTTMAEIWKEEKPNFFSGYNILGFDFHYMDARLRRVGEEWPDFGYIPGTTKMQKEIKWSSSAAGNIWLRIPETHGCPHIDLLMVIKRNVKLDKYDLGTVSKHYLKRTKHPVKPIEMFKIYQQYRNSVVGLTQAQQTPDSQLLLLSEYYHSDNLEVIKERYTMQWLDAVERAKVEMSRLAAYCVEDSELVIDIFDKINSWITHYQFSNILQVTPMTLFTRGQQVRIVSQLYAEAYKNNVVLTRRSMPYQHVQGAFVGNPKPGYVPFVSVVDFSSMYPTNIEEENMSWDTLIPREAWDNFPADKVKIIKVIQDETEDLEYEEDEDAMDVDNNPLPSTLPQDEDVKMQDSVIYKGKRKKEADDDESDDEDVSVSGETETGKTKKKKEYEFRWYQGKKGLLPLMLRKCINARNVEKAIMKKLFNAGKKDSLEYAVADNKQEALKCAANSAYGATGAQNSGKMSLYECTMCTTFRGREKITLVNETFKRDYGAEIVYNDTDSAFIKFPNITTPEQCNAMGEKAAEVATALFKNPSNPNSITKLEHEKSGDCIFFKAKKYVMVTINKETKDDQKAGEYNFTSGGIIKRGIAIQRRDYNEWTRECYTYLLMMILYKASFQQVLQMASYMVYQTLSGKLDINKLVLHKKYNGGYKSDSYPMEVFAKHLKDIGKPVMPGDQIDTVIVNVRPRSPLLADGGNKELPPPMSKLDEEGKVIESWTFGAKNNKGYKLDERMAVRMRDLEEFLDNWNDIEKREELDLYYYVEHQLMNPIDQLISVSYNTEMAKYICPVPIAGCRELQSDPEPRKGDTEERKDEYDKKGVKIYKSGRCRIAYTSPIRIASQMYYNGISTEEMPKLYL
jgi:DNA polymerase delta subunit 1